MISVQYYECYCTLLRGLLFWDTVYREAEEQIQHTLWFKKSLPFFIFTLVSANIDLFL